MDHKHVKLENPSSQTGSLWCSFENFVNGGSISEVQEQAKCGIGNKTGCRNIDNGTTSSCKSRFISTNYNKQLYQCHRCGISFLRKLQQLTCHKIRYKYSKSKEEFVRRISYMVRFLKRLVNRFQLPVTEENRRARFSNRVALQIE